jgi:hypothetical protein
MKSASKNPAHGEPPAGSETTQALPAHPRSRRWSVAYEKVVFREKARENKENESFRRFS